MVDSVLSRLTHLAEHAVTQLRVSSALDPCLWLAAIAMPFGIAGAVASRGLVQIASIVLVFLPVTLFVFAYIYFMVKDPDKLRSENYELRKTALGIIQEKGAQFPISDTSVEAIANSEYQHALKPFAAEENGE